MAALKYWVWLSALKGLSARAAKLCIEELGGAMEVFFARSEAYDAIEGLSEKDKTLLHDKSLSNANRIIALCHDRGIHIMTAADAAYPQRLSQLYDAPQVLYLRGRLPALDELPVIAVVGTRTSTPYGEKIAADLGYQLAEAGAVVVSGLAKGNDAAAAKGALMAGGKCIGVLGTAIDVDYPAENSPLIRDVAAVGCVLSEYPPGYGIADFPRRNRIISGLCNGVCVVEAPEKSGALITAAHALEQGRDIFAVPGNVDSPNSVGCNALIREGARLVTCGRDILEEYSALYDFQGELAGEKRPYELPPSSVDKEETIPYIDHKNDTEIISAPDKVQQPPIDEQDQQTSLEELLRGSSESQQSILRLLWEGEKHADEIIASTGLSAAKTMTELTFLRLRGLVLFKPAKRYQLKKK